MSVGEVNPTGRVTMGVRFISLTDGDTVVGIARNAERAIVIDEDEQDDESEAVEESVVETPADRTDNGAEIESAAEPTGEEGTDE